MNYENLALELIKEEQEKKRKSQKGFTLIELLVVIAIIVILLAAIVIPQFTIKCKRKVAIFAATGALTQCISEVVVAYAKNNSNVNNSCKVGNTTVDIVLNRNTGEILAIGGAAPGDTFKVDYSGYILKCKYDAINRKVSCE